MHSSRERTAISEFASGFLESYGRNHEALQGLVDGLHKALNPTHTILSVSDWRQQKQLILASAGVPEGIDGAPLEMAICRFVGEGGLPIWFNDAETDVVFSRHPAVVEGGLRAYIGAPILDSQGDHFGCICCRQITARVWSDVEQNTILEASENLSEVMIGLCDQKPWSLPRPVEAL